MKPATAAILATAIRAGLAYFLIVFAFGFVLGTIRTLFLVPRLGPVAAVALELPFLLLFAWVASRRLVTAFGIGTSIMPRAVMGDTALLLVLFAEFALAVLLFGRTPGEFLSSYRNPDVLLGLCGQLLFAALPVIQRLSSGATSR